MERFSEGTAVSSCPQRGKADVPVFTCENARLVDQIEPHAALDFGPENLQ